MTDNGRVHTVDSGEQKRLEVGVSGDGDNGSACTKTHGFAIGSIKAGEPNHGDIRGGEMYEKIAVLQNGVVTDIGRHEEIGI